MAYADLLEKESIRSRFLVVLNPTKLIDLDVWTNVSGDVYSTPFSLGYVNYVELRNSVANFIFTEGASSGSLSAREYYYDFDNSLLYINIPTYDPNDGPIICRYEIYLSTFDANFYRDPLDSTTDQVYWEPIITNSPSVSFSVSDNIFGFITTSSTSFTASNAEKFFNPHFATTISFNKSEVRVYHYLDELSVANTSLILSGNIESVNQNDQSVTFSVVDKLSIFNDTFSLDKSTTIVEKTYTTTTYSGLDPSYIGAPIRHVYGLVDGFVPINLDYEADAPSTSNNRTWGVMSTNVDATARNVTTSASPSSTTTRTYVSDPSPFNIGDGFHNTTTNEYAVVTSRDATSVSHTAVATPASSGDNIRRYAISKVDIISDSAVYTALPGRDYSISTSGDAVTIVFNSSMESNVGMPADFNPSGDRISCRVYGGTISFSDISGLGDSANDSDLTASSCNPAILIADIIFRAMGIGFLNGAPLSDYIDETSFLEFQSDSPYNIGMSIPANANDQFPTYREVLENITKSSVSTLYLGTNGKWKVKQTKPVSTLTVSKTIEDDEILNGSISYDFDYKDVYRRVMVSYNRKEFDPYTQTESASYRSNTSETARQSLLHGVDKNLNIDSVLFYDDGLSTYTADVGKLAASYAILFCQRRFILELSAKNRFFDVEIGDVISVSRSRFPGYTYDEDTLNTKSFVVVSIEKSLKSVKLRLDDLQGIEDRLTVWTGSIYP